MTISSGFTNTMCIIATPMTASSSSLSLLQVMLTLTTLNTIRASLRTQRWTQVMEPRLNCKTASLTASISQSLSPHPQAKSQAFTVGFDTRVRGVTLRTRWSIDGALGLYKSATQLQVDTDSWRTIGMCSSSTAALFYESTVCNIQELLLLDMLYLYAANHQSYIHT